MQWWDLGEEEVPELKHLSFEELLRNLSFHAIRHHPLMFVSAGLENVEIRSCLRLRDHSHSSKSFSPQFTVSALASIRTSCTVRCSSRSQIRR
jgi:hypothetical protein